MPTAAEAAAPTTAGGRLMWIVSDELDLLGDLWVDLPFAAGSRGDVIIGIDTRTTIERSVSALTFSLRDLIYDVEVGYRGKRRGPGSLGLGFSVGQRGREHVDANGQPWVRYVGATLRSTNDPLLGCCGPGAGRPIEGWVFAGAVVEERETRADAVLRGAVRFRPAGSASSFARRLVLDARVDGLIDGIDLAADVEIGPAIDFALGGRRRVGFFLRYLHAENPLGVGDSGVLAGFEYEGETVGRSSAFPPAIEGIVALGGGDDARLAGQFLLRFYSPTFLGAHRAVARVDANILTADDTGDLYYFWEVGIERPVVRSVAGVYLYHRSNHELAEPNDRITSLNVLDFGIESVGAERPGLRRPRRRSGAVEGAAHAGVILDSSFGEDLGWHVRAAVRWSLPPWGPIGPFVRAEAEAGDADRYTVAAGASVTATCDVEVSYRADEQYASADRSVLLLGARLAF